jgi:hypothetical protein
MYNIKMTFKTKILEKVSAKCDNFLNSYVTVFFFMTIPCHCCITKPLNCDYIRALGSEINYIVTNF